MNKLSPRAFSGALAGAVLALHAPAHAAITTQVNIDFQGIPAAVYGAANLPLVSPGLCAGSGNCYFEDGMIIGVVDDPVGIGEHVHRAGAAANRAIAYHADSSGIYLRAGDASAFSITSLDFNAPISIENPDSGPGEEWEILGFNLAENPALASGDGTHYASRVAYQTVANGFDGLLTLNDDFLNIKALWIHYLGYPRVPDAKDFDMEADNFLIGPAVARPAVVPLPAAGWLLMSAMAGLGVYRRRASSALA